MRLWRVSEYADLSGRGGILTDARWNRAGTPVVYCTDHPATALLEKLVHLDMEDIPTSYQLFAVEVPEGAPRYAVDATHLPKDWRSKVDATRALGTELLVRGEHLVVWVPCALVPEAWNVLLNPRHVDSTRCVIAEVYEEPFDPRLIR